MQTDDITKRIEIDNIAIQSKTLNALVMEQRLGRGAEIGALEKRYAAKGLPIQTKKVANPQKVNEKLPNDFYGDVVDNKQGYMGNEVTVELDKTKFEEGDSEYDRASEALHDFATLNDAIDENSETVKYAAIGGISYRLLYIPSGENEVRIKRLPGDECVIYTDPSLDETQYAMRYWYVDDTEFGHNTQTTTKRTVVEWYDRENITYYIDDGKGNYIIDPNKGIDGMQPHLFDGVPIIAFKNNEECLGEPEKAIPLIDAYDTVESATVSEIEQFRLAYLALSGVGGMVDNAFVNALEQTGVLPLTVDGKAEFVTKDMAVDGIKIILDELRKNIYEFSKSIDLSKDYGGDLRVIGWQVALLNMENSAKVTERKFKKALREQWRMISAKWKEWGIADINYLDLVFGFTRNFPKDVGAEADILMKLLGLISRKKAYSMMSFIEDPEAEIEAFEMEREANMALTGLFDGTGETSEESEPINEEE